ncbi:hypothetical protein C8Q76DRAFT_767966 [Earliella scabrosa]|nr:hypothetical protein C8Q76DRAFT_767966 [Earliella scabrosa]
MSTAPPSRLPALARKDSGYGESPTRQSSTSSTLDGDSFSSHPPRTLVLCFDGTGDQFDADNSNVVSFFSLLKKDDRHEQMVYYQPGIGTYTSNTQNPKSFKSKVDNLLDKMVAWNLGAHVMGGYEFLMQNYQAGDKICLFGFSRGAYTARALAGMVTKVGLLPACNHQQIPFAYDMYIREDQTGWEDSKKFKKDFSIDVHIDFIGVWDTVDSVGIIPHTLPFTKSNSAIRYFRHALALDEHRVRFKPALYRYSTPQEAKLGTQPGDMPTGDTTIATSHARSWSWASSGKREKLREQRKFERAFSESDASSHQGDGKEKETDVLEVWFAGCHCDVGGGSVKNDEVHSLARISLRWMVRECFKTDTGIRFHGESLKGIGLDPATLYPIVQPRPAALKPTKEHRSSRAKAVPDATEEEHEVRDAQTPIVDQLVKARYWWLLEIVPGIMTWPHMGKGRHVPTRRRPFYVHRSVKTRMEAEGLEYKFKAEHAKDKEPIWVD